MEIIKCPNCGKEILSTQNSCFHCGYDLKTNKLKVETPITLYEETVKSAHPTNTVTPRTTIPAQNIPKVILYDNRTKSLIPVGIFLIVLGFIFLIFTIVGFSLWGAPAGAMIALIIFCVGFIVGGFAMIGYKKRLDSTVNSIKNNVIANLAHADEKEDNNNL